MALREASLAQLESGHDVAYTAPATRDGVAVAGVSAGPEGEAGMRAVIGRDEAVGVEYVATKDGVVAHAVDATANGVTEAVAAATTADDTPSD